MGNVSELSEVCKPQNVVRRSKVIKVLMKDFFNKNLTKSMRVNGKRLANYNQVEHPSYLTPYEAEKKVDTVIFVYRNSKIGLSLEELERGVREQETLTED